MASPQSYAASIEHTMRGVFDCDHGGIGGLVDSDCIRRNPFMAMISTLAHLCEHGDTEALNEVSDFFRKYFHYRDWSIDELLKFDGNSRTINDMLVEIEFPNGEEAERTIIEDFSKLCRKLKG